MRRFIVIWVLAVFVFPVAEPARAAGAEVPSALDAARARVAAGDTGAALRDLQAYVPGHPDDLDAARFLGDLYFRVPDYRHAEATWKAILLRVPEDRQTHNRLGSLYAVEDRVADAIAQFEQSLPSRGGFAGLVDAHRRQGDLAEFQARYARVAEQNPLDARAASFYANVLYALRDFSAAQPYFERAAALSPKTCEYLVDAGNDAVDLGRVDDALRDFQRCLALDPGDYAANVDTGEAFIERGDDARAQPYLDRALARRPDGAEALVDMGYLEDDRGRWKAALGDYLRAMNADPLASAAYVDVGYDYNEHGLYDLAEAAFIKGLSIAPQSGRLHYLLAVTYNVQGKVGLARDQYGRAIASREPGVAPAAQAELALLPPPR